MGTITNIDSQKLLSAMRIWSGWGGIVPNRDDSRLTQQLGSMDANLLLPVIKKLESDFYTSDARYIASDLEEMGRLSKLNFESMHPNLNVEIGDILSWCYTFDFK